MARRPRAADLSADGPIPSSSLDLLHRLQRGEPDAKDELLARYWPRLERWARGRVPTSARDLYDTVDLVQETFLAALGRIEQFEPEDGASFLSYLRAAVLNRVRTLARRAPPRSEPADADPPADPGPSPLEELIGREALDRYERALARLRPEDRHAIHLKVELDLPYEAITRELGRPSITASRMAVSRALCRLAREMGRDV